MILGIISLIMAIIGLSLFIKHSNTYDPIKYTYGYSNMAYIGFCILLIGVIGITTFIIVNADMIIRLFEV